MIPQPVLAAIDRLNGHARSYGCGKDAIYAYKSLACLMLALAGGLQARPVALMVRCHRCQGTGWFHWDGVKTDEHCLTCAHAGFVHLCFAETTIGPYVWHHPYNRSGHSILLAALKVASLDYRGRMLIATGHDGATREIRFESPGEWTPRQRGERLQGEALAAFLNVVEDWIDAFQIDNYDIRVRLQYPRERAQQEMKRYALDLGRTGAVCHYCCNADVYTGQHHIYQLLEWSIPSCRDHTVMPVAQWDNDLPPTAITPEVERWLGRRGWTFGQPRERNMEAA